MKRVWKAIRSRRLAVWAIIAFAAYAAVSTVFVKTDYSAPYRNPLFLVIAAVLTISTGACAWERTRWAFKNARMSEVSEAARRQLAERPALTIPLQAGVGLEYAERALRSLRMKVQRGGDVLQARAGMAGAFGSPIFHWSLTLLFVVIALGQLTRSEGLMGVVEGTARPDEFASYRAITTGPLAGPFSGYQISVPKLETDLTVNGISRGATPFVEILSQEGEVLASGYAYANHPIRYRSMLVHDVDNGLAVVARIESQGETAREEVLLDYSEDRLSVEPAGFMIASQSGEPLLNLLFDLPEDDDSATRTVRMRMAGRGASPEGAEATEFVIEEGQTIELQDGVAMTVERLTTYARLSVVDDWSVYPIYALFAMAVIGVVLAIFMPLRAVRVMMVDDDGERRLHAVVRHSRGDPHFPARVEAVLARECGPEEEL